MDLMSFMIFYLYYILRFGFEPEKIYRLAHGKPLRACMRRKPY